MTPGVVARWFAAALLLLNASGSWAAKAVDTLDRFHEALRGNRPDQALDALAKDAVIYEQGFAEVSREEWARKQLATAIAFARDADRRVIRQRATQDDRSAWVISRTRTVVELSDRKLMLEGAETAVLRREGDQWKIVHLHWSAHEGAAGDATAASSGAR